MYFSKRKIFLLAFALCATLFLASCNQPKGETVSETTESNTETDSFRLSYNGLDTGIEIYFKDCVCEYDKKNVQVYSYFVDDPAVEAAGYAIYIQTPDNTMNIFPVKDYQIDKNAGSLYMIWGIKTFERIQGVDFLNSINGYKIESVNSMERLIGEAYGLELSENEENFDDLQAEFTGLYEENGKTLLRGRASALYNASGEKYSIEWEIDTETLNDSATAYPTDSDATTSSDPSTPPTETATPQSSALAAPSTSGALHVAGTQLTDSSGNAVQLKGISTHGIAWYPNYINEQCFGELKNDWNANVIRLALYTAESNGYCTGGNQNDLKTLVKNGVKYATAQDMYVIIDWHVLSDQTPKLYQEEAKQFFTEMASEFSDYNNVLYEICNEPNGNTSWSEIKSYAQEVIGTIRAYDKDAVIIVGTPNWSQYVNQAAADPITGYDNLMYALHFYAATHTDDLRNTMVNAHQAGLPIFVSEYGICDASGNGAIDTAQAEKWIQTMNTYGISYVAWNLSNKAETSALINNGCQKTSGFTYSDFSDSGKWIYEMLTGQNASALANASDNSNTADTNGSSSTETQPQTDSPQPTHSASGQLSYTCSLVNSWESDGIAYFQYTMTLKNNGTSDCSSWSVELPFNESVSLSNGWNGTYSVKGKTLHISSVDYNGTIASGGSINDIGFIVYGSSNLKLAVSD